MIVHLNPLKNEAKAPKSFGVFDIESMGWDKHLVNGYYCKDERGEDLLEFFYSINDFIDFAISKDNPHNEIFAHFGGMFDFLYLLRDGFLRDDVIIDNIIPRGSSILCFDLIEVRDALPEMEGSIDSDLILYRKNGKLKYRGRVITFRDSGALLPFGLGSLTENFGVSNKKLSIDYNFTKVTPELLEYLEYDLKGLYQVILKFREWPLIKKAGAANTVASQAMRVFRTTMKAPLRSVPRSVDRFVRKAYFGGRTEIFKPLYMGTPKNPINVFDVNSLYPTVMRATDRFPGNFKEETFDYDPEALGIYDAVVEVPGDMYMPPLGVLHKVGYSEKLIFPTGKFKGRWTTREIEYARSLGVKILRTGRGMIFEDAGPLFREYIDMLYHIRESSAKDSVDNVIAKLLMNSCYGRFGLNLMREVIEYDEGQAGVSLLHEFPTKSGSYVRLMKGERMLDKSFTNVMIANWVTSEAKLFMHKLISPMAESAYYMDTDSVFTTDWLSDTRGLGGLKHEYSADAACFLLPKTYALKSAEQIFKIKDKGGKYTRTDLKLVMKGFRSEDIREFGFEDMVGALEGDLHRLKCKTAPRLMRFKSAIKSKNLVQLTEESTKGINSRYDKRRIIKTSKGYDTEPLVIRDGAVINYEG